MRSGRWNQIEGLFLQALQRAPTSLNHALDRGDLLQAQGRYYLTLARRPGTTRRSELQREARSFFQKELAIWQEWTRRKVAAPYASRRETQALAYLAACDQP